MKAEKGGNYLFLFLEAELEEMKKSGKSESEIGKDLNAAPLKVRTAKRPRREATAGYPGFARRLHMGSPIYVSNLIHA